MVASIDITTSRMVARFIVATKHMVAIWEYCHEWTCCKIALLPPHSCMGIWPYCYAVWSIASKKYCNVTNLVAGVTIATFIWWWQQKVMQWIIVGGNRWKMQQIIVGGNEWYFVTTRALWSVPFYLYFVARNLIGVTK